MASRTLKVEIVGDASSLNRAFGQVGNSSSKLGRSFAALGKVAAVGVGAAFVGLAATLKVGFGELAEGQKVAAQTGAVLKSTGGIANVTAKQVDNLATSLSQMSGVDDEVIGSGENMLLTFKNIRNEAGKGNDIFKQSTATLLDMSVALGTDMNKSAIQLGKALNDPIKGITALTRVGVTFDEGQKKQIKSMVESGNVMGAQKLILAELNSEFGGSAKAAGETLPGQLNKLKNAFEEVAAKVAGALLPALMGVLDWVNAHMPEIQAVVDSMVAGIGKGFQAASSIIASLAPAFQTVKAAAMDFLNSVRQLLPTLQSIGATVLGVGLSPFAQSAVVAAAAMVVFHRAITAVIEVLIELRAAAAGAGLAALVTPVGLLTAAVGALVFAFIASRNASDAVGDSIDRQRAALLALRDATNDAANSEQRLKDAKIAVKQATLDVSKALERRNVLEQDGKQKTQDYTQAQIDVQRAYANRQRAELELRQSSEGVTDASNKGKEAIKGLGEAAETARAKLRRGTEALGDFGNETGKHQVVNAYAREMEHLAKQADAVAKNSKNVAPNIAAAAVAFASQARAAADVAKKTGEIPAAFLAAVGPSRVAGSAIGSALGQGIAQGIDSQVGNISAAAAGAVRAAEAAARSEAKAKSPSELFAAIGRDIDEGLKKGIVEGYDKLKGAAKDAVDKMIDASTAAIIAKQGVFTTAFSGLVDAALAAFDRLSEGMKTAGERALVAFDLKQAKAAALKQINDLKDSLTAALSELAAIQGRGPETVTRNEGEKDDAFRERQLEAEKKFLADVQAAQATAASANLALQAEKDAQALAAKRASLEKQAAQERKDLDDRRERQRLGLANRLSDLQNSFLQGEITVTQFTARMAKILDKAGIPLKNAAAALGASLAAGLLEAKGQAVDAARELAAAIRDALGNISVAVKVHVSSSRSGADDDKRAAGGPVKRGKQYLVGEQGPELFVPSASGKIVSNANLAAGGARALGGGGTMVFNFPNYVGDRRELEDAMQSIMLTYQRRNGFGFAG